MDCLVAMLLAMTTIELRIRLDQPTLGNQRADLDLAKPSRAQNLPTMFTQSRRMLPDRGRGPAPCRRRTRNTQCAFGRVLHCMKQSNGCQMRVVDQAVEVVQRRMRNV